MRSDGNILIFNWADATYLVAYLTKTSDSASDRQYQAWQSTICQECDRIPTPGGHLHIVDDNGFVLICCEGYHQVNPSVLGIEAPDWHDWHEEMGGLLDDAPIPPEMEHLAVKCIGCGITRAVCLAESEAEGGQCCETCIHSEKS